jgi:hypothetical protein
LFTSSGVGKILANPAICSGVNGSCCGFNNFAEICLADKFIRAIAATLLLEVNTKLVNEGYNEKPNFAYL